MMNKTAKYEVCAIEEMILIIRGQKVILDADLARLYGVTTRRLNEQVRRNPKRFPVDFAYQLTVREVRNNWSQIATSSGKHRGKTYRPIVFTEHGAIMAANVLNSRQAVEMSVFVVRAFIKMREQLLNRAELEKRLTDIERVLLSHDAALRDLYQKIRPLLLPPPDPPRKPIGFEVRKEQGENKEKGKQS